MHGFASRLRQVENCQVRRRARRRQLMLESLEPRCLLDAGYLQTNLVSDIPNLAQATNPNLVNPWGFASSPTGPLWVNDNGTGVNTVLNGAGQPFPVGSPLVVTIPPPAGSPSGTTAAPTGTVFNPTSDFAVTEGDNSGPAVFLFATEEGTISGWNPKVDVTHAILEVNNTNTDTGPVYKGLAMGDNAAGNFLFATNFRFGTVDVFDTHFNLTQLAGSFTDPNLPAGYAPFGIQNIEGRLYVTYALQNGAKHDDVAGPGHGFIDVFDTDGNLMRRLVSQGPLNSPWGLALAPGDFGPFSRALVVGNFGDGHILAFNRHTGSFRGEMEDTGGNPISINGLWGLKFGNGGLGGDKHALFFAAGINDEADGLFGTLQFAPHAKHPEMPVGLVNPSNDSKGPDGSTAPAERIEPASGSRSFLALVRNGQAADMPANLQRVSVAVHAHVVDHVFAAFQRESFDHATLNDLDLV